MPLCFPWLLYEARQRKEKTLKGGNSMIRMQNLFQMLKVMIIFHQSFFLFILSSTDTTDAGYASKDASTTGDTEQ